VDNASTSKRIDHIPTATPSRTEGFQYIIFKQGQTAPCPTKRIEVTENRDNLPTDSAEEANIFSDRSRISNTRQRRGSSDRATFVGSACWLLPDDRA
jgi:hypothetical protein